MERSQQSLVQNENVSVLSVKPSVFSLRHADSKPSLPNPHHKVSCHLEGLNWVWLDITQLYRLENAGRWGIATMVGAAVGTFSRCQHTLAHLSPTPAQPVENESENGRCGLLKILVSVVRFRPGPPAFPKALPPCGALSFVLNPRAGVRAPR